MNELDDRVAKAYAAWDLCHMEIAETRMAYERALDLHSRREGEDPAALRERIKDAQVRCDQLFFAFLRAAEARTSARYI